MKISGAIFVLVLAFMMFNPAPDPQTITATANLEAANQAIMVTAAVLVSALLALFE